MYLEELLIEGFKSYVSRTHITGWDPEFNAITGLNGTGKSNILDAICFVLGITNLSQVRASNLQDLIYKRGQAGVSKASVTIVFNNEDRDRSPVGFENYNQITVTRQVLMGGRTKYIVNGHNAQQQTVQNLFQSVQLNINNPHFLIMQGRITKVLNMRPAEILSMVEEAAGTKMFEDRKNKAIITMAKKERKVEEINTLLAEDIAPKLDQLRVEKRVYLDFQKNESEMERLNKYVISYEYHKHEERLNKTSGDNNKRIAKMNEMQESVKVLEREIGKIEEEKQEMEEKMRNSLANGSRINELEKEIRDHATQLVRFKTKKGLIESSITDEQKTLAKLVIQREEMEYSLKEKRSTYSAINGDYKLFKQTYDEKTKEMMQTDELIQTLTTGIAVEEGHENGYMEQLQQAKRMVNEASTLEEQTTMKIAHLKRELAEAEPRAARALKESQGSLIELEKKKTEIKEFEKQLDKLNWNPEAETSLTERRRKGQEMIDELIDRKENLSRKLSNLDFEYSNPHPDFDRSKVKGLVAELFSIDKDYYDSATAIEICAGGKLFNVVVENEKVGAQLLNKGRLRRRWTLIPLNKIQGLKISASKLAAAEKIAPGKAHLALNLIGYDDEVHHAMEWIFGSTFICEDAATAKDVTFNKDIRIKSVTLQGDIYDPHGTLSGGSRPNSGGILIQIQELNAIKTEIKQHQDELDRLDEEIRSSQKVIKKYREYKQKLDLQSHQLSLLEQRMSKSSHAQLATRVQSLKDTIKEQENTLHEARKGKEKSFSDCRRIENEMNEFNNNKDTKLEEMAKHVEELKILLRENASKMKEMQRAVQTYELEIGISYQIHHGMGVFQPYLLL
ncbi:hypothetical protein BDB01DRAFT_101356 [Pilobolus umbonatus]|nr:hypothetical protein BDB01DRAFT_101356 [Pilobolus umbonatus]